MKMIRHYHILYYPYMWLMMWRIFNACDKVFPYFREQHFSLVNISEKMFVSLCANGYKIFPFIIVHPCCTWCFPFREFDGVCSYVLRSCLKGHGMTCPAQDVVCVLFPFVLCLCGHVMPCPYRVLRSHRHVGNGGRKGVIVGYAYTNVTQA